MNSGGSQQTFVRVNFDRYPGVTWLELAAPQEANCLSVGMIGALETALEGTVVHSPMVAISAAGANFCAGFDIRDEKPKAPRFLRIGKLLDQLLRLEAVTVAIVAGNAVGAGADLAAHCDVRVALPNASFRFPGFQTFGVVLGNSRLREVIGIHAALEAVVAGRAFGSEEAVSIGLATMASDDAAEAQQYVEKLGSQLANHDRTSVSQLVHALRGERSAQHGLAQLAQSLSTTQLT